MKKINIACLGLLIFLLPVQAIATDYTLFDQTHLYAQLEKQTHDSVQYKKVPHASTWRQLHKCAGYTTAVLAGATAISSSNEDFHEAMAYATAAAALTTITSGVIEYRDRFDLSEGLFAEDNRHILTGALGALLMVTAVVIADDGEEGSHSSLGIAGGALMGVALIDIKW